MTTPLIDHAIYKTNCALAASGQLSQDDWDLLEAHCRQCDSCRERLLGMAFVNRELVLHAATRTEECPMPEGSVERFLQRAAQQGMVLRQPKKLPLAYRMVPVLATLAVFALMLTFLSRVRSTAVSEPGVASTSTPADMPFPAHDVMQSTGVHRVLRTVPRARRFISSKRVPVSRPASRTETASLAPERFKQAIPSVYPFFKTDPTPPINASYPALSSAHVLGLDLFSSSPEASAQRTVGVATLYHPDVPVSFSRFSDAAAGMQQLRFQLPINQ